MSWINRNIRTTNRVFRALRGGKVNLSARTLADATAELCANYRSLMIDNSFRTDIIEASQAQSVLAQSGNYTAELENELPCHFDHAIALLVEAGVDGEAAVEAVRSLQELFPPRLTWIVAPDTPPQAGNPPPPGIAEQGIEVREVFSRLRMAQREVCGLHASLAEAAAGEERRTKLKRWAIAGIGLTTVGVAAGPLGWLSPAVAWGAGVGLTLEAFKATIGAIGSTMFQHYTSPDR